jgi:two-component response regulator transcription regulator protein
MYSRPAKILIIDDDVELITLLVDYFTLEGFEASPAHTGTEGLEILEHKQFDLIILDVMMPGISGVQTLQRIREKWRTPVLMLTARGDPVDRILGLELGADDYVPKPCSPRELVARIRAILRRSAGGENSRGPVQLGELVIDMAQRRATYKDKPIPLTGTELSLLEMLARSAGEPVAKADIYPRILGRPMGRYDRAIDVHISAIRHKLAQEGVSDIAIESVRGVGYQLVRLG